MFSEKSKKIIDSCRFCWMCHHICPIGNATGQERNTARARALALSLVMRDAVKLTTDLMDNMYECTLCGGCTCDCITGWDPTVFIKEVRNEAGMQGKLPTYIEKMLDNIDETGNVYGIMDIDKTLADEISTLSNADTLLLLGMDARYRMPQCAIDAIKVLKKADIGFTVLADEPNSGWALDTIIGAAQETKVMMQNTAEELNKYKEIIVFDPADAKAFTREYKEWGIELIAKITTFTAKCAALIENGSLKVSKSNMTFAFQDPALLVREVGEVDEPRKIITACGELKEMLLNKKGTMFAGNLLMAEYIPDTMKLIAQKRWENAVDCGADALVTASVSEYALLNITKPENMKLFSIEQLILNRAEDYKC